MRNAFSPVLSQFNVNCMTTRTLILKIVLKRTPDDTNITLSERLAAKQVYTVHNFWIYNVLKERINPTALQIQRDK